jgi:Zn-finger nucleic acid-binding protein
MWYSNDSFADFEELQIEDIGDNLASKDQDQKTGMCPSGHGIMIRAKVDIDEPFYLEKCTACGGIWFDKGEWQRIAENNLADNLSIIWSRSWQRKQSPKKNRDNFLKTNRKLLGEKIFTSVLELAEKLKDPPEKDRAIAFLR